YHCPRSFICAATSVPLDSIIHTYHTYPTRPARELINTLSRRAVELTTLCPESCSYDGLLWRNTPVTVHNRSVTCHLLLRSSHDHTGHRDPREPQANGRSLRRRPFQSQPSSRRCGRCSRPPPHGNFPPSSTCAKPREGCPGRRQRPLQSSR